MPRALMITAMSITVMIMRMTITMIITITIMTITITTTVTGITPMLMTTNSAGPPARPP